MPKKILILGATGMLGHKLFNQLFGKSDMDVYATARTTRDISRYFSRDQREKVSPGVAVDSFDSVVRTFATLRPDIVINCIGLIKQLRSGNDALSAITLNAQLPHRLSLLCRTSRAKLIHISTDCVFNGRKGMYSEDDTPNAEDLYGRTKCLGEVTDPHCLTLRTSIIGHELKGKLGLVEWFLDQTENVKGFTRAIFSGFPTVEFARIIDDYILPKHDLSGIYHVSSQPISKYDLLSLIAHRYSKNIQIVPDNNFSIDRSLDSSAFKRLTGYIAPPWPEMVNMMYEDYLANKEVYSAVV